MSNRALLLLPHCHLSIHHWLTLCIEVSVCLKEEEEEDKEGGRREDIGGHSASSSSIIL